MTQESTETPRSGTTPTSSHPVLPCPVPWSVRTGTEGRLDPLPDLLPDPSGKPFTCDRSRRVWVVDAADAPGRFTALTLRKYQSPCLTLLHTGPNYWFTGNDWELVEGLDSKDVGKTGTLGGIGLQRVLGGKELLGTLEEKGMTRDYWRDRDTGRGVTKDWTVFATDL